MAIVSNYIPLIELGGNLGGQRKARYTPGSQSSHTGIFPFSAAILNYCYLYHAERVEECVKKPIEMMWEETGSGTDLDS